MDANLSTIIDCQDCKELFPLIYNKCQMCAYLSLTEKPCTKIEYSYIVQRVNEYMEYKEGKKFMKQVENMIKRRLEKKILEE